ncbi:hypothetical protein AVEN_137305-1 [Araneus ventricosus]|uniref:Integrase catalytic domain-containing protein n=1 Tax=Araneus ventricosus TaxID=182803 RepID=A0A4Y2MJX4_ARAVE|nr:hypothetical protein AVEN_137305-1 [Araneus ventricosus]
MSIIEAMAQIFSRMGFPKEMQTDQGTSFMSNLAVEFTEKFGIKVTRSSVHHPQSNPVERFHRTIKIILKVLCRSGPEWEKQVPAGPFALRTIRHKINMILKIISEQAELVNIMITEDKYDIEVMDENFPTIESEPTLFDFEEIKESSSLNDKLNEEQIQELHDL